MGMTTTTPTARPPRPVARIAAAALVAFAAVGLAGCGVADRADLTTQRRPSTPFDSIELRGYGDVTVTVGEDYDLVVRAREGDLDRIHTRVQDGTLVLSEDPKVGDGDVSFEISVPSLQSFEMLGAGTVHISGVYGPRFAIAFGGAGEVTVVGEATDVVVILTGAGTIDATGLKGTHVTARLDGVGTVDVWATSRLEAHLNGVGQIQYSGNPPVVESDVDGLGSIERQS